jgi:hypothetical protein
MIFELKLQCRATVTTTTTTCGGSGWPFDTPAAQALRANGCRWGLISSIFNFNFNFNCRCAGNGKSAMAWREPIRGNSLYRIRLNHNIDSSADTIASKAAAAANSAVISVDFFSSTSRELSDL